jgi:hypothetical protein
MVSSQQRIRSRPAEVGQPDPSIQCEPLVVRTAIILRGEDILIDLSSVFAGVVCAIEVIERRHRQHFSLLFLGNLELVEGAH